MPRLCSICSHPRRPEIDAALIDRVASFRDLARQFGTGHHSMFRHTEHIIELVTDTPSAMRVAAADTLLEKVQRLEDDAREVIDEAREALETAKSPERKALGPGGIDVRIKAIREFSNAIKTAAGVLELLGRVSGELQAQQNNVNVLVQSTDGKAFLEAVHRAVACCDGCRERVREELAGMVDVKRLAA